MNMLMQVDALVKTGASRNALMLLMGGLYILPTRQWIVRLLKHCFVASVEIDQFDAPEAYNWIETWLTSQSSLSLAHERASQDITSTAITYAPGCDKLHILVPQPCRFVFFYRMQKCQKFIYIFYTIRPLGGHAILHHMFEQAQILARNKQLERVSVYTSFNALWTQTGSFSTPSENIAILPNDMYAMIANDIRSFFAKYIWYVEMGIPYRRGYLFHGPPGTGKTTLIRAIAIEFGLSISYLNINSVHDDRTLMSLFSRMPKKTIIALEDIDVMFSENEKTRNSAVTLAGFLNCLDGVIAQEGYIVIMTSNNPERLSDALVRPGRIDMKIEIGYATDEQISAMFGRFFPGKDSKEFVTYIRKCHGTNVALADIQQILQMNTNVHITSSSFDST